MSYDGGSYVESMRLAQEHVEYESFRVQQRGLRGEGRYVGIGFSPFVEPTGFGNDIARVCGITAQFFDCVSITVEQDGSVTVTSGLHSHGQGHETISRSGDG